MSAIHAPMFTNNSGGSSCVEVLLSTDLETDFMGGSSGIAYDPTLWNGTAWEYVHTGLSSDPNGIYLIPGSWATGIQLKRVEVTFSISGTRTSGFATSSITIDSSSIDGYVDGSNIYVLTEDTENPGTYNIIYDANGNACDFTMIFASFPDHLYPVFTGRSCSISDVKVYVCA